VDPAITLLAAVGIGLTTSLGHCIGMCGPLVSTYSLAQGKVDGRLRSLVPGLLMYNLGRVNTYAIIGLAFGLLAAAAHAAGPGPKVRGALFLISGLLMVFMGIGLAGWLPTAHLVQANPIGRWISRRFMGLIGTRSMMGRYLLGMANGFLPCGPVYAVAVSALAAPTPLHGAGTMAAFGLGTVPVMLAIGLGAGRLAPALQKRFNLVASILVFIVGLEFLFRAGKMFGLIKAIKWGFIPIW